eukprot:scaffold140353_cov32-Tisochrysis_lutea.AAC.3
MHSIGADVWLAGQAKALPVAPDARADGGGAGNAGISGAEHIGAKFRPRQARSVPLHREEVDASSWLRVLAGHHAVESVDHEGFMARGHVARVGECCLCVLARGPPATLAYAWERPPGQAAEAAERRLTEGGG